MKQFDEDKIEAYLLGNLSPQERTLFEVELQTNEELVQTVADFSDRIFGIETYGEQQFLKSIQTIDQSLENEGFFLEEGNIDQHLKGTATPQVEKQIQQRIKNDPEFAESLKSQKDLIQGIEVFGEQDFMAALKEADQELANQDFFQSTNTDTKNQSSAKMVSINRRRLLSIAAAIGGVIIGSWAVLQLLFPSNVFDKNYVAYTDELTPYLNETGFVRPDYLEDLTAGMELYNQQEYMSAKLAINNYLQAAPMDEPYRPFANFYLAQSYLATGAVGEAIPLLENLVQGSDFQLREDAQWYLALSYLKNGAEVRGKELLRELSNSIKYGKRARELL